MSIIITIHQVMIIICPTQVIINFVTTSVHTNRNGNNIMWSANDN